MYKNRGYPNGLSNYTDRNFKARTFWWSQMAKKGLGLKQNVVTSFIWSMWRVDEFNADPEALLWEIQTLTEAQKEADS